jgi:putative ABC transport system permease protein
MQVARVASGAGLQQRGAAYADVRTRRLRGGLVVGEVAATLILLVVAGLFIKTLYHLRFANLGLRPDGVLTLRTSLPFEKYGERARRIAFYDEVLDRGSHLPGVVAAAYTTTVPLEWKGGTTGVTIEGRPRDPGVTYEANHRQVSVGYVQTIGISLRRGRYFGPSDTGLARRVAIVNETMARQYWPDDDAVGRRFRVGGPDADGPWLTIVGIVGDVRQMGLDRPVKAEMYLPYAQVAGYQWFAPRDLVVRVTGTPLDAVSAIVREVHAVDPDQPVSNIRTLDAVLDEHAAGPRLQTTLMAAFAVLALLLAATGVYGLLSHFVAEHLPEIGVRMALGAQRGDIVWLVVGRGLLLSLVGAAIGAIGALAATTLIANQLYLVDQRDPSVFLGAAVVLVSTAALASFLPAQRATRLDPVATLRAE